MRERSYRSIELTAQADGLNGEEGGAIKQTWYLSLQSRHHKRDYNEFRMEESSFKFQLGVCVIQVCSLITHIVGLASRDVPADVAILIISTRYLSIALFCLYTLYLAEFKKLTSIPVLLRLNPVYVCNSGFLLAIISSAAELVIVSTLRTEKESEDIPVYLAVLIMFQMTFSRLFFRLADFWVSAVVVAIGTASLASSGVLFGASVPTISLCVLVGIMAVLSAHEYESNKLGLYVNYTNLELAIRTAMEHEHKKKEAERLSEEMRSFIGNVAHDLKTPLQAFVSELGSLGLDSTLRQRKSSIATLDTTCSFMLMMINRSLDFVKSESGVPLVASMGTVDLKQSMEWVTNCIKRVSNKVPLRVIQRSPSVCRCIITDKQWLEENLLCLTSNSIKFTTTGYIDISYSIVTEKYVKDLKARQFEDSPVNTARNSRTGTLEFPVAKIYTEDDIESQVRSCKIYPSLPSQPAEVDVVMPADVLLFEVEDTGIGLTKEQRNELFQPFKQAQRKAGGTGLGLYALARRVEAAGGMYGVCRRHDGNSGSLFWFSVPYRPDVLTAASLLSTPKENLDEVEGNGIEYLRDYDQNSEPTATNSVDEMCDIIVDADSRFPPQVRILLVDDTPLIQKTTRKQLQREGYFVASAVNGVECLNALKAMGGFDVVLLDMHMPVMDGMETIRRIRANEAALDGAMHRQFVIGVSAFSDTETKDAALAAGMDDFIVKPLTVPSLRRSYENHLRLCDADIHDTEILNVV